ncbi:MAG: hypothetical protein L3J28_04140 [Candidatus Polarisedimenticolaceae bacterium]|nr:hypothetical protein [Candidatus Polarisedimenticolaceae bacterium]
MGLLDDLKSEAEKLQNQQSSDEVSKERLEAIYREDINPKMQMISNYFTEFVDQLNILKPATAVSYTIPGYKEVTGLIQQNYSIRADSFENMKKLRLRFSAELPHEIEFSVTPKAKAAETRSFLEQQNFTFSEWPVRDAQQQVIGITCQVKLKVEIMFMFQADIENSAIKLSIVNFENFGVESKSYRPDSINESWLEDIGHYILRENETLHTLEISDEIKQQLRDQLKREALGRAKEMKAMEKLRAQQALEQEQKENRFIKMFKKTIKGSKR